MLCAVFSSVLAAPSRAQDAPPPALPDSAFDAQLPPLDATVAPPAAIEPASSPDPELAAPLPPLAQFEATPPPAPAATAATEPTQVRYTVELSGLKQVGLEDEFKGLSALQSGKRKAVNASQVAARAAEDVKLSERLLRAQGYYDAVAIATVDPVAGGTNPLVARLTATPGPRYDLGAIAVTGMTPEPEAIARDALGLKTGAPIVAAEVETGEANVALRLPENGYPFVTVGQRDILLDPATHVGDYTLPVTSGPKARFGGFQTAGDPVFGVDHLKVFPRFKPGQVYDSRKVDDLRQALVGTSLFSSVAVEPVRTGAVGADGTETVDLLVTQNKGPWRSLAAQGGYGTGEGVTLTGSWTHRNLFKPEGALIVAATAGTLQQSVSGTFRRSNAGVRDRTFQAGASVSRQRFDAYKAQTIDLTASLSRQSTPIWQKRWTYSIGAELLATREKGQDPTTTDHNSTYLIAALPLQGGYDRSDSLLDPTKGFRISGKISPEAQKQTGGGGFDSYVRLLAETSGYYPVGKSIVLAARARIGSIVGVARDDIAPSRRLYAGGGGSVRGFGYQQLGPKDADNNPIGGRSLTEFAIEARYRFGNYGIVPFFDAGRVGVGSMPSISNLRYGAGIGARYYTNFGPMRIDIATPIGRKPGESKIALYISIGQAF